MPNIIPEKIVVTREGGAVNYVPTPFKRGDRAKNGEVYPSIDPNTSTAEIVAFLGDSVHRDILLSRLNLNAQAYYANATTGKGDNGEEIPKPFDEAEFVKAAETMSSSAMTRGELQDAIIAGWAELHKIVRTPGIPETELRAQLDMLTDRIKGFQNDLDSRKRKKSDEDEDAAPAA